MSDPTLAHLRQVENPGTDKKGRSGAMAGADSMKCTRALAKGK